MYEKNGLRTLMYIHVMCILTGLFLIPIPLVILISALLLFSSSLLFYPYSCSALPPAITPLYHVFLFGRIKLYYPRGRKQQPIM